MGLRYNFGFGLNTMSNPNASSFALELIGLRKSCGGVVAVNRLDLMAVAAVGQIRASWETITTTD